MRKLRNKEIKKLVQGKTANKKQYQDARSHCGTTGSTMSLECWGIGSIPSPPHWVKDSVAQSLGSNPWSGNSKCLQAARKEKKEKEKGNKTTIV